MILLEFTDGRMEAVRFTRIAEAIERLLLWRDVDQSTEQ